MNETKKDELVKREEHKPAPVDKDWQFGVSASEAKEKLQAINQFQGVVKKELKKGHDFGIIPGTGNKPTLFKPGAEKIVKLLNLYDDYEELEAVEVWDDDKAFFHYKIKCTLSHIATGCKISSAIGSCNSKESKYRYNWIPVWKLTDAQKEMKDELVSRRRTSKKDGKEYVFYRLDNEDPYSLVNTIQKMACKRALIGAALSAGRLSDMFSQDFEDMPEEVKEQVSTEDEDETEAKEIESLTSEQGFDIARLENTLVDNFEVDPTALLTQFRRAYGKDAEIAHLSKDKAVDWIKILQDKVKSLESRQKK